MPDFNQNKILILQMGAKKNNFKILNQIYSLLEITINNNFELFFKRIKVVRNFFYKEIIHSALHKSYFEDIFC